MRKWIAVFIVGILGITMQACAPKSQDDCGFVQNVYGERISWKGQVPITLRLHTSVPQDDVGAIENAIKTWNEAAGKTMFVLETSPYSGTAAVRDRTNVISFSSTWETDRLSEQAKTQVHWVGDQIQEADIKVNAAERSPGHSVFTFYWDQPVAGAVNLEALILHELGHVLGLKHNDGDSSVMGTYLASNTDRTSLSSVDSEALQCEY